MVPRRNAQRKRRLAVSTAVGTLALVAGLTGCGQPPEVASGVAGAGAGPEFGAPSEVTTGPALLADVSSTTTPAEPSAPAAPAAGRADVPTGRPLSGRGTTARPVVPRTSTTPARPRPVLPTKVPPIPARPTSTPGATSVYRNCAEARAAGVTPILAGQSGYAGHLDRDSDGVACEWDVDPGPAPVGPTYRNCTEARAAGVTPLRRGDPGYAPKLDRDGDGIACENTTTTRPPTSTTTSKTTPKTTTTTTTERTTTTTEPAKPVSKPPYANCAAARAAGVTPIKEGEPGYSAKLDGDGDGIACE